MNKLNKRQATQVLARVKRNTDTALRLIKSYLDVACGNTYTAGSEAYKIESIVLGAPGQIDLGFGVQADIVARHRIKSGAWSKRLVNITQEIYDELKQ